jgi:hypothetical protein
MIEALNLSVFGSNVFGCSRFPAVVSSSGHPQAESGAQVKPCWSRNCAIMAVFASLRIVEAALGGAGPTPMSCYWKCVKTSGTTTRVAPGDFLLGFSFCPVYTTSVL